MSSIVKFVADDNTNDTDDNCLGILNPSDARVKRKNILEDMVDGTNTCDYIINLVSFRHQNVVNLMHLEGNFAFLEESGEDVRLVVPWRLNKFELKYHNMRRYNGRQTRTFDNFYYLHSDFRLVIRGLIRALKDLHLDRKCTTRKWDPADVRIIKPIDVDGNYNLVVKLMVPITSFFSTDGEFERTKDVERLGACLLDIEPTLHRSAELTHLLEMMTTRGNFDKFPLLNHPALLSHEERLDLIYTLSRDMRAQDRVDREKFLLRLEDSLEGYVTPLHTDNPIWYSKIHGYTYTPPPPPGTPPQVRVYPFPTQSLLCSLDKIPDGGNESMLRFMGNVRGHLIDKVFSMHGMRIGREEIDCWLSGTFDMALVRMTDILWDNKILKKVTNIVV